MTNLNEKSILEWLIANKIIFNHICLEIVPRIDI